MRRSLLSIEANYSSTVTQAKSSERPIKVTNTANMSAFSPLNIRLETSLLIYHHNYLATRSQLFKDYGNKRGIFKIRNTTKNLVDSPKILSKSQVKTTSIQLALTTLKREQLVRWSKKINQKVSMICNITILWEPKS